MLKPVQVTSRVQLSEQSCSEDDDVVSFAASNAHITGPFCVFLDFLYDTTSTESSDDDTDTATSSSSSRNIGTNISFIFALFSSSQTPKYEHNGYKQRSGTIAEITNTPNTKSQASRLLLQVLGHINGTINYYFIAPWTI